MQSIFKWPFRYRFDQTRIRNTQEFYFPVKLQLTDIRRTTDKSKRTTRTMCTENTEWTVVTTWFTFVFVNFNVKIENIIFRNNFRRVI